MENRLNLRPTSYASARSGSLPPSDSDITPADRLMDRRFRDFEQEIRRFRHGRPGKSDYMTRHASARSSGAAVRGRKPRANRIMATIMSRQTQYGDFQ